MQFSYRDPLIAPVVYRFAQTSDASQVYRTPFDFAPGPRPIKRKRRHFGGKQQNKEYPLFDISVLG